MHSFILVTHSMNIPLPDTRTRSSSEPIKISVLYIYTLRGNPAIESHVDKWKNGRMVVLSFLPSYIRGCVKVNCRRLPAGSLFFFFCNA